MKEDLDFSLCPCQCNEKGENILDIHPKMSAPTLCVQKQAKAVCSELNYCWTVHCAPRPFFPGKNGEILILNYGLESPKIL